MSKVQGAAMGQLQSTTQVLVQRVRAMHCIKSVAYIFSCETPRTCSLAGEGREAETKEAF